MRDLKLIDDLWDRKVSLNNRPLISNRDIEVIKKTQELFPDSTIGDAISLLMRDSPVYIEILEELKKEGYPTI